MARRVWHITGANTGFGLQLALKALAEGDSVVAAVRNPAKAPDALNAPQVQVLQFDLGWSQEKLNDYAKEAMAAFGRVDALVNNAAYAYMGAIEETEDAEVKKQFDINVFGVLRTIRAFLPGMREQGSGIILNISSIGGLKGYPSNGVYCATKFAIEGITESLNYEIAPFGLKAAIVQPGYFRTEFLANPSSGANLAPALPAYAGTVADEARANFTKYNGRQPGNPIEGAARIWEYVAGQGVLAGKEQLLRLPLGSDTGAAMRALAEDLTKTADDYEPVWSSTDFKD